MENPVYSGILEEGEQDSPCRSVFTAQTEVAVQGHCLLVKAMRHGRWWMLKGLQREFRRQSRYRELLRKEFEIGVSMQHPGVVQIGGFEEVDGIGPCIVMEWVDGEDLARALSRGGKLARKERRRIFAELLDAVEYIHSHQVAHRDLKPSNILITRNGRHVKLIDFGLSDTDSHAMFKQPAGTPDYISPEQLIGNTTDQRNDIYSLGCILRDLNLGWAMQRVVRRCLRPLNGRYANVGELRRAFRRAGLMPCYVIMAVCAVAVVCVASLFVLSERNEPRTARNSPQMLPPQQETRLQIQGEGTRQAERPVIASESPAKASSPEEDRLEEIAEALAAGQRAVDQWVAATGMGQRIDTLTKFRYIEKDYMKTMEDYEPFIRNLSNGDVDVELRLRLYFAERYANPWGERIEALNDR